MFVMRGSLSMKMLISAGGTGGHIMPALAVARELRGHANWEIHWMGSNGMESSTITKDKFPFHRININALRGSGLMRKINYPFIITRAVIQALKIIKQIKPCAIFITGGYTGVPAALAGALLRKPVFVQEQNIHNGMATKLASLIATRIYNGFPAPTTPSTIPTSPTIKDELRSSQNNQATDAKTVFCGNPTPLEDELNAHPCDKPQVRYQAREGALKIFVTGGSQGAEVFNKLLPECLAGFPANSYSVWHQAGAGKASNTAKLYNKHGIDARVDDFIPSMRDCYCWADLVIARAGALTLAELAIVGVASILVPFPYAADNHQMKNAMIYANNQAAIVCNQNDFTIKKLSAIIGSYISDKEIGQINARKRLGEMATKMHSMATPGAASFIVNDMLRVMKC